MSLPPRKIGDALVPPIGFGAMGISIGYGQTESDEERFKVCREHKCRSIYSTNLYVPIVGYLGLGCRVRGRLHTLGYRKCVRRF